MKCKNFFVVCWWYSNSAVVCSHISAMGWNCLWDTLVSWGRLVMVVRCVWQLTLLRWSWPFILSVNVSVTLGGHTNSSELSGKFTYSCIGARTIHHTFNLYFRSLLLFTSFYLRLMVYFYRELIMLQVVYIS